MMRPIMMKNSSRKSWWNRLLFLALLAIFCELSTTSIAPEHLLHSESATTPPKDHHTRTAKTNHRVTQEVISTETQCNGLPNLCDIPVNEIMYASVHNAMSSLSAGFVLFANHIEDPIVASLDAGYRSLGLDICKCGDSTRLQLCHGNEEVQCGVGRRDAIDTLRQIHDWMQANPKEVVVLDLEVNFETGGDISLQEIYNNVILQVGDGFEQRLYQHHDNDSGWPTLAQMIAADTRLLLFYIRGPLGQEDPPPGIHYYLDYGMRTPFSYATVNELRDETTEQACPIRQGQLDSDWLLMNAYVTAINFLDIQVQPSQNAAETIHTADFLQPLLDTCERSRNKRVNFVVVDFWNTGNVVDVVQANNARLLPPPLVPSPTFVPIVLTSAPSTPVRDVVMPTSAPSRSVPITESPTMVPSTKPSDLPSLIPSSAPSDLPSKAPSEQPSAIPSQQPSSGPSTLPSDEPSLLPSDMPSNSPSDMPSSLPSQKPRTVTGVVQTGKGGSSSSGGGMSYKRSRSCWGTTTSISLFLALCWI